MKIKLIMIQWILIIFLFLSCQTPITAQDTTPDFYEKLKQASLEILINGRLEASGWICDEKGYAITCAHAFKKNPGRIEVISPSYGRLKVELIAINRGGDIALLKLPEKNIKYDYLKFAEKIPSPGTKIYSFGAPMFRHKVLLHGTVGKKDISVEWYPDWGFYVQILYFHSSVAKGVSGAPWVDQEGDIIGLQSGMMISENASVGIAYSSPLKYLKNIYKTKTTTCTPSLRIAAEELWEQPPGYLKKIPEKIRGLVVKIIPKKYNSKRTPIKELDIIIKVNHRTIEYRDDFIRFIRQQKIDQMIELEIYRPSTKKIIKTSLKLHCLEKEE